MLLSANRQIDTRRYGSITFKWGELIFNHALGLPLRTRSRGYTMISLRDVSKTYRGKGVPFTALKGINLTVEKGEFLTIIGPSGAGKSTLLNVIGLLDSFDEGSYRLDGREIACLRNKELAQIRLTRFGFVFQSFYLINHLSAIENVEVPLGYSGVPTGARRRRSAEALEQVGLGDRLHNLPSQLSGGEQQRVAIARALVNSPDIIFADEPTGNLDSETSEKIIELFYQLNSNGITVAMVTHSPTLIQRATRIVKIRDGKIEGDIDT